MPDDAHAQRQLLFDFGVAKHRHRRERRLHQACAHQPKKTTCIDIVPIQRIRRRLRAEAFTRLMIGSEP